MFTMVEEGVYGLPSVPSSSLCSQQSLGQALVPMSTSSSFTGLMYEFEVEAVSMALPPHHKHTGQVRLLRLNIIMGSHVLARQVPRRAACQV